MENKLEKQRHPKLNFYAKRIGLYFSIFIGASFVVAIPVTVAAVIKSTVQVEKENDNANQEDKKEETTKALLVF